MGGPESHGAQARSPFRGRNGTAPTGETVSRKEAFLRPYAAYAKVAFLLKDWYTRNEIPTRAATIFDYFGSAVMSRGGEQHPAVGHEHMFKMTKRRNWAQLDCLALIFVLWRLFCRKSGNV